MRGKADSARCFHGRRRVHGPSGSRLRRGAAGAGVFVAVLRLIPPPAQYRGAVEERVVSRGIIFPEIPRPDRPKSSYRRPTLPTTELVAEIRRLAPRRGEERTGHSSLDQCIGTPAFIHRSAWKKNSRKFAVAILGLCRPKEGHPIATWSGHRRYPGRFATNRA